MAGKPSRLMQRGRNSPQKSVKKDSAAMASVMNAPLEEKCEYFTVWMDHHAKLLMSVIEDTTKRVEIVTLLPHIILNLDKYKTILGVNMTRMLERHGEIIGQYLECKDAAKCKRESLELNSETTPTEVLPQPVVEAGKSGKHLGQEQRRSATHAVNHGEGRTSVSSSVSEPDLDTLIVRQNRATGMMSHSCKNILRHFQCNPHAVEAILQECAFRTESSKVLVKSLRAVGNVLLKKFLTGKDMIEKEKEEEMNLKRTIISNNRTVAELTRQVEAVIIERENDFVDGERQAHENYPPDFNKHDWFQVAVAALVQSRRFASIYHIRRKREIIERLVKIMTQIENAGAEYMWRIEAESRRQKASILRHSEALKQKLRQQIIQLKQQFDSIFKKNVKHERHLRKTAYKIKARAEAIVAKVDESMFVLQDELDCVEALYKKQKEILEELEERFLPLDAEYTEILQERALMRAKKLMEDNQAGRRQAAAKCLQAFWRSYMVRKTVASKSKKKTKGGKKKK